MPNLGVAHILIAMDATDLQQQAAGSNWQEFIAGEIKAEIGRSRRSQRWLAAQLGRDDGDLSRILNGKRPMDVALAEQACRILGLDIVRFSLSGPKPPGSKLPHLDSNQEHSGYWSTDTLIGSMSTVGLDRHLDRRAA